MDTGVNPYGGDGGAEFNNQCSVSKKEQSQESKVSKYDYDSDYRSNAPTKKKKKYGEFAYKLYKNGNPILRIDTKTGSEVLVTSDKALEKYYHQDVYNLETPKNFYSKEARSLKPKD